MKQPTPLSPVHNKVERIEHAPDGGVTIIKNIYQAAPDELIALSDSGLEECAWKALMRSGELPARRIGRRWWTTRSALAGLVTKTSSQKVPVSTPEAAYANLVASARGDGQ